VLIRVATAEVAVAPGSAIRAFPDKAENALGGNGESCSQFPLVDLRLHRLQSVRGSGGTTWSFSFGLMLCGTIFTTFA